MPSASQGPAPGRGGAHKNIFRRQRAVAVVLVAFTLGLTVLVYRVFAQWHELRIQEVFVSMATDQVAALRQSVSRNIEILHSVRDLYSASNEVERDEFRAFTEEPLRRHGDFYALEWAPRVTAERREEWERTARAAGGSGFMIWERDSAGRRVPAGPRDEVYPVTFAEPDGGNETAAGFDLGSSPERRATLDAARDRNSVAFSAPISLVQAPQLRESATLIALPVFDKTGPHERLEDRRARLAGYVVGAILIERMGEAAMRSLQPRGLEMHIVDITDKNARMSLFERSYTITGRVARHVTDYLPFPRKMKFHWATRLEVGGRLWHLDFHPAPGFVERHREFTGEFILVGGFLFATLLGIYFRSAIRRAEEIELLIGDLSAEVAERRRTEEALRVAAEEARRSEEEMRRLNENLQAMNVKLQELDRLKSDFLATVSHELRTPVATIRGAVENQLSGIGGPLSDTQRRQLEIVNRSSSRLGRLIENLLDVTRLEAGRFSVRTRPVDLRSPLQLAVESLRPLAERARIHLESDLPAEPIAIEVDPDRIVQVMTNLLDNAIRFATSRVVLSARDRGHEIEIRVGDDGPGIPPEEVDRVFDRFTTRDASGSKSHMGLGLSIVRAIVEAHGGRVRVEPPGGAQGGAVFVVRLPRTAKVGPDGDPEI
jgi:two-component system, OmpR family, sensor kinase